MHYKHRNCPKCKLDSLLFCCPLKTKILGLVMTTRTKVRFKELTSQQMKIKFQRSNFEYQITIPKFHTIFTSKSFPF